MQYSQGTVGRVFTLRLEDGERVPHIIEDFAKEHDIESGLCVLVGGIGGGNIVVGPEDGDDPIITPMVRAIAGAHEVAGVGTLFRDTDKEPVLHMHAALGRDGETVSGCIRPGLDVWLIGEVIIIEFLGLDMHRRADAASGFKLLEKA